MHAATTFSQFVFPPLERGTTWSNVSSVAENALLQYSLKAAQQGLASSNQLRDDNEKARLQLLAAERNAQEANAALAERDSEICSLLS